jgi:hypothetical protein
MATLTSTASGPTGVGVLDATVTRAPSGGARVDVGLDWTPTMEVVAVNIRLERRCRAARTTSVEDRDSLKSLDDGGIRGGTTGRRRGPDRGVERREGSDACAVGDNCEGRIRGMNLPTDAATAAVPLTESDCL